MATDYSWDINGELPMLVRESGELVPGGGRDYLYGHGLTSMSTGGQSYYYQRDGLGSVVGLTSADGTPQWSYSYEPYGTLRSAGKLDPAAPDNPMRFAGEYFNEGTGLYHLRAREYDPSTGRFLSMDPVGQAASQPYVSPYVYANSSPTRYVDPSGRIVPAIVAGLGVVINVGIVRYDLYGVLTGDRKDLDGNLRTLGFDAGLAWLPGGAGLGMLAKGGRWVWKLGSSKSSIKWANQMKKRGWTSDQIDEAIAGDKRLPAVNNVNPGGTASRYVHPETGRSVVIDDKTGEVLHVGGDNYKY